MSRAYDTRRAALRKARGGSALEVGPAPTREAVTLRRPAVRGPKGTVSEELRQKRLERAEAEARRLADAMRRLERAAARRKAKAKEAKEAKEAKAKEAKAKGEPNS